MKKILMICLAFSLIAGCICGCGAKQEQPITESAPTQPSESSPAETAAGEEIQATQPSATEPPVTLPSGAPQASKPQATEPQATNPQATKPQTTEPQPTKPVQTTVPAIGTIIDNLTCTIAVGNGSPKTIENPLASSIYHYIKQARSNAVQKNPSSDSANTEDSVLHISVRIGEEEICRLDLYADDYASIPLTLEFDVSKFYLFPSGTYQAIRNTIR